MITYIEGDLFSSPAQVLVNTVNTVGVMGKGIALEFKKRYPEMFSQYKTQCDRHKLLIGKLMLWYGPDHWVLQFPTKEHWRNPSKMEYIEKGLMTFVRKYADYNISSVAFPKLGCGNGELNWNDVKPLMEKYLKELPINVYIYLGNNNEIIPEHKEQKRMSEFLKANAKDLSYLGVKDEIRYGSAITPLEFDLNGETWNTYVDKAENIIFESKNEKVVLEDENAHEKWDRISQAKVFTCDVDTSETLLCELLFNMGYIHHIKIQTSIEDFENGYQLDEGKGRMFLVRGYDDL